MRNHRLRAVFMRGGTSKAVMFRREDLPADRAAWDDIFLQVMGSPDPYGRQLDGMGGGLSSLSKICVIGPPSRADADVDFTFAQVCVGEPLVDYSGNCGNMSAAIGPFAIEEGMIEPPRAGDAVVRIHNTNTAKVIVSRFPIDHGQLAADGEFSLDGVAGHAAPIRLEFIEPGGAKTGKLLPTGAALDVLSVPGLGSIRASCVDAANPVVFVSAKSLGLSGGELPDALGRDLIFLNKMEAIRLVASVRMGIAKDADAAEKIPSVPKVAMVCAPRDAFTISDRRLSAEEMDVCVRMMSLGQPHKAVPITGAICLAIAARLKGSVVQDVCRASSGPIRIAHPSGTTLVDAAVTETSGGVVKAEYGAVYRSARRLFEGNVVYRAA